MNKWRTLLFKRVREVIANPKVQVFTLGALAIAPTYFWTVPASSTGKYHPAFAQGKAGLVRHTLAAVEAAEALLRAYPHLNESHSRDLILSALFLHDTIKQGTRNGKHTVAEHPLLPRQHYQVHARVVGDEIYDSIMCLIETHMGIWPPPGGQIPCPEPDQRLSAAEFVHLCDYIAASKPLEKLFRGELWENTYQAHPA